MAPKYSSTQFPFWQFLNQPLFNPTQQLILNPQRFWYHYRVQLLNRCWVKEYRSEGRHHQ